MDDVIEARLGMSLDDLIKEQKKAVVKKLPQKKSVPTKAGNNATNSKPGVRRPAPGKKGAPPTRTGNPNQRLTKQLPGAKGPGGKPGPLKTTRGGGVQKKNRGGGSAAPTSMHIDPPINGKKARPRNRNGLNAGSGPQGGRSRPNTNNLQDHRTKNNNKSLSQRGGGNPRNSQQQQQQQQQKQQGRRQPQQQQQQQQPRSPSTTSKRNKQPRQQQNHQQMHQPHYDHGAPPGFGGPPPTYHNPYQDALYAKSQKPLFARFEDLQRVPMDAMAAATVTRQPEFMAGPMNKHGVRLPV